MFRANLSARHAMTTIDILDYIGSFDRLCEAGPAGPAIKFIEGREQWLSRHHLDVEPGLLVIPVFILERALCPVGLRYSVLFWRQPRQRFRIFVKSPRHRVPRGLHRK